MDAARRPRGRHGKFGDLRNELPREPGIADQRLFVKALYEDGEPEGTRPRRILELLEHALAAARRHLELECR